MKIYIESQNLCLTIEEAKKLFEELKVLFEEKPIYYPIFSPIPYKDNEPYYSSIVTPLPEFNTVLTFSEDGLGSVSARKQD